MSRIGDTSPRHPTYQQRCARRNYRFDHIETPHPQHQSITQFHLHIDFREPPTLPVGHLQQGGQVRHRLATIWGRPTPPPSPSPLATLLYMLYHHVLIQGHSNHNSSQWPHCFNADSWTVGWVCSDGAGCSGGNDDWATPCSSTLFQQR